MIRHSTTIINKLGLHARAAAKFVRLASQFSCEIKLVRGSTEINAKSILGVMMLAAAKGTDLEIVVHGADEAEAVMALDALVKNKFDESE